MRPCVIDSIDPELFPDVDPLNPPRDLSAWEMFFCHDDAGLMRLLKLVKGLQKRGYEGAQRGSLVRYLCDKSPFTDTAIDNFLYRTPTRLRTRLRKLLVRHLFDIGLLPTVTRSNIAVPADSVQALYQGLSSYLGITRSDLAAAENGLPGRYWIHRPSACEPGQFMKGLMTVEVDVERGSGLTLTEQYLVADDVDQGEAGFQEIYDGVIMEKSHRPMMLSCLRQPALGDPQTAHHGNVSTFCMTMIAGVEADSEGRIVSMTGLTATSHATRGFLASPVCFDRIPEDYGSDPQDDLGTLEEKKLPRSVRSRLASMVIAHGFVRL